MVLAMVKFSKSPKTSQSSLFLMGEGVVVLEMVKFSKSPKTSQSSLFLMGEGVVIFEMVKFSKSPRSSISTLSLIGEGVPNLYIPKLGRGGVFGVKFGASLSPHKIFHSIEHRPLSYQMGTKGIHTTLHCMVTKT